MSDDAPPPPRYVPIIGRIVGDGVVELKQPWPPRPRPTPLSTGPNGALNEDTDERGPAAEG